MATSYSGDLRARVIGRVEGGMSRREVAEQLDIGASTAIKWFQRWRDTGSFAAKPRGGSVSPLEACAQTVLALNAAQPDATLDETVEALRKQKIATSRSAVYRFFQRHKITFKKNTTRSRASSIRRRTGPAALDQRTRPT
jgi:transposase